jgi:hypothetical protein
MAKQGKREGKRAGLTPRQRKWLGHLRACRSAGQTMRGYAARHGFSEHALYQAAKDLRRRGVWPVSSRGGTRSARVPFVRLPPAPVHAEAPVWRVRLPNGVLLEAPVPLAEDLLTALAQLRG